jgi:hypothetical protein
MNNQEKMQNIYDLTGVEPRMWRQAEKRGRENAIVLLDHYTAQCEIGRVIETLAHPHYPESQLWEMLRPVVDIVSWDMYFIVLQYRKNNQGELKQIQFSVTDLHTALLDMVLWRCENGYIKILEEKE